ncbi:hypothetical protein ASC77_18480 [Nocardioides sp. Root1257]|uniref:CaiB/BaiF CoA transferase family protein n=1 Tax=unclassified Nocardioides TaxID=2615069 RepID=UPI0006F6C34B|nr:MULTISPECIES: CoA transferase [unclassified Nocardioides]KQW45908.1 hypothetical protein ASC77_18480 [Nocardioides sp. Root1257]KRC43173.1 hypothetical protein ASE24_19445 [Nocardioides sp. Root224]
MTGIRVLDLTRALSGPFCTALLGDLGADVVKVESPQGELCRKWGPYQGSESLYFIAANRNKRSLALDIWSEQGRALLREMVGGFDVLVENFRPGVMAKLDLDSKSLAELHPHVIVASISGFGHVGPRSGEACFDQVAQGMGGLMSITGSPETGPLRSGIPLADNLSGMFAALGICAALVGRRQSQTVHTSLLESVIGVLTFQGQRYLSLSEVPDGVGNDHPVVVPYGVFRTADSPINLAAGTAAQFGALCAVVGRPELVLDPRFEDSQIRRGHKDDLRRELESRLVMRSSSEWLAELKEASVPCGPINDIAQAFGEPQVEALQIVQQVEHPVLGTIPIARGPLWMDGAPTPIRLVAPQLGQHSVEVLEQSGIDDERIAQLVAQGVVAVRSDGV